MPNFAIGREIPDISQMSDKEVRDIAQLSLGAVQELGIQWLHSYVTNGKVYCIYWAPNADLIRQHASRMSIPANRIAAVKRLMEPATAD